MFLPISSLLILLTGHDATPTFDSLTYVRPVPDPSTRLLTRRFALDISLDGRCGGKQTCLGSKCGNSCSQYGWCGSNSSYSGVGCNPAYGTCDNSSNAANSLPLSNSITVTPATGTYSSPVAVSVAISTETPSTTSTVTVTDTVTLPRQTATSTSSISTTKPSPSPNKEYVKEFLGDGSVASGWPSMSEWLSFDALWTTNFDPVISASCSQYHEPDNSAQESADLRAAILALAAPNHVDARFVLAIALQESGACVRAPTTIGDVPNPGIFQTYRGNGTCNAGEGRVQTPCPATEIQQMVKDAVTGTGRGSTCFVEALKKAGTSGSERYYRAARVYNSGSVAASGLLQDGVATHCYATDVANRLIGWNSGPTKCTLDGQV